MTGAELKAIRKQLGLSVRQMGLAFGYQGNDNTVGVQIRQYETYDPATNRGRPIPPWIERLALMYSRHGVPAHWTERT